MGVRVVAKEAELAGQATSAARTENASGAFGESMLRQWLQLPGPRGGSAAVTGSEATAAQETGTQTMVQRTPQLSAPATRPVAEKSDAAVGAGNDATDEKVAHEGPASKANPVSPQVSLQGRTQIAEGRTGIADGRSRIVPGANENPTAVANGAEGAAVTTAVPVQTLAVAATVPVTAAIPVTIPGNAVSTEKANSTEISSAELMPSAVPGPAEVVAPGRTAPVAGPARLERVAEKPAGDAPGKPASAEKKKLAGESAAPQSSAPQSSAPQSSVPQSSVPQSSVPAQLSAAPTAALAPTAHVSQVAGETAPAALPAARPTPIAASASRPTAPGNGPAVLDTGRPAGHPISAPAQEHAAAPTGSAGVAVPVQHAGTPQAGGAPSPALNAQQNLSASVSLPAAMAVSPAAGHAAHAVAPGAAFDRIDSGSAPQMLSHTPQRLDVGVRDPGLGWVEIRAHAAEGQIAATVSASSASHPALAAQLPAMRDYLAGQQVRVDALQAQPFDASSEGGRNSSRQSSQGQDGGAAAAGAGTDFPDEAEPERFSWIDVRV
jgi:hypothetical protein